MAKIDRLQTISTNSPLWAELNDEDAQTINGGYEEFTIYNETGNDIKFSLDGDSYTILSDYYNDLWSFSGGKVTFDKDFRAGYQKSKKYDLKDGRIYAFLPNTATVNVDDFDLYEII